MRRDLKEQRPKDTQESGEVEKWELTGGWAFELLIPLLCRFVAPFQVHRQIWLTFVYTQFYLLYVFNFAKYLHYTQLQQLHTRASGRKHATTVAVTTALYNV